MSNTERERKFRRPDPSYFRKHYAAKRVRMRIQADAATAAARAAAVESVIVKPKPLILHAPVQDTTLAAIAQMAAARKIPAAVPS